MKELICYSVGGLGNRLRPLSSIYSISIETKRSLKLIWEPVLRCLATYDDLYETYIERSSLDDLLNKDNLSIYALKGAVDNEIKWKNQKLTRLIEKFGYTPIFNSEDIKKDESESIIIIHNDFIDDCNMDISTDFLKNIIKPTKEIKNIIENEKKKLNIDRTIIGVHARGTDFNTPIRFYTNIIDNYIKEGYEKFFVCSDSDIYESEIKEKYKDKIITRENKIFVSKDNKNMEWTNNVYTSKESVKDALIDLYLLSYTNFKIFKTSSTFAIIINKMKEI